MCELSFTPSKHQHVVKHAVVTSLSKKVMKQKGFFSLSKCFSLLMRLSCEGDLMNTPLPRCCGVDVKCVQFISIRNKNQMSVCCFFP